MRKLAQIAFAFGPTLFVLFLVGSHSHEIGAMVARLLLPLIGTNLVPAASAMSIAVAISVFGLACVMIQRWLLPTLPEKDKNEILTRK